ncbi:Mov34/MPN/PAD-1 family protein [Pseudomonas sp. MMS21-TM103]|uniref:Mov34/MPN/PAD-1 family protein n=1 Tax=Pseudomonas sp. MMS21 TM103 TaxID=2886506 RepID=UPI001EDCF9BD|nr:Mov34/MPN/PAD-1 family protein [Pseudomonas sp. MMS21 TM103]MCG4454885.1 Mov34/MPN/PAD-1 family protein [Pseudomonas sp. MMS21 TM103]
MTAIAWRWGWPGVDTHLLVSQDVASLLERYCQRKFDVERGGQLFVDPSSSTGLVLALATPPHGDDRAGRTWLELNARRCRDEIERANAEGLRLVGYWHTHPQSIPMISPTDIGSFSRFAARYTRDLPHPMAIIVGNTNSPEGIKAWSFREGRYVEAVRDNRPD